jgi:hypothetical protein
MHHGGTDNGGVDVSAPYTFRIKVNHVDQHPVVSPVVKSGTDVDEIAFSLADFSSQFEDSDPGDTLIRIKVTSLPEIGVLLLGEIPIVINYEIDTASLPQLRYISPYHWQGSVSFTWNGSDGMEYANAEATLTILLGGTKHCIYLPLLVNR